MKNGPYLILALLLGGATLTGCLGGGSSSGGGGNGNDGGDDEGSADGGSNGGETGEVIAPEDTQQFGRALMLDYPLRYSSGETDWATIEASHVGHPDQQPQRIAADISMLGVALASALHYMDNEVLAAGGGDDEIYSDTFHEVLGFQSCQSSGSTSPNGNSITFADSCVVVTALDDREIVLNGQVTWQDDPGALWPAASAEPTRLLEFENLEVRWNDQNFVINGALADEPSSASDPNDPDASPGGLLHMAWDATHEGEGRNYRFARQFNNTLGFSGAADTLAFHPELGAVATLLSESWYVGSTCEGGGITDVAVRLDSGTLDDQLTFGLAGCDAYFFTPEFASANLDSSGVQIRPELYRLLASIGMANDSHTERALSPNQEDHYELAAQEGPVYLAPEEVEIGRIGAVPGNGGSDTAYQVTLSFDLDDIQPLGIAEDQVVAGVLRFYVASRGEDGTAAQGYPTRVTQQEWAGPPDTGDIYIDSSSSGVQKTLSGHPEEPWHIATVSEMVEVSLMDGLSRIQMVASAAAFPGVLIQDGEYISGICLRDSQDCSDEQLPVLMIITED